MAALISVKSRNIIIHKVPSDFPFVTYTHINPPHFGRNGPLPQGAPPLPLPVTLSGVTSLDIQNNSALGVQQGIRLNFLQPWYNKFAVIKIAGRSYFNAYSKGTFLEWLLSASTDFAPGSDKTVQDVYNNFVLTNLPHGNREQPSRVDYARYVHILSLENHFEENTWIRYVGFITSVQYNERVDSAFIYDYSIEFTGYIITGTIQDTAKAKADADRMGLRKGYNYLKEGAGNVLKGLGL